LTVESPPPRLLGRKGESGMNGGMMNKKGRGKKGVGKI